MPNHPDPVTSPYITNDEKGRISALHRYHILDTAPEAAFDEVTKLAANLLSVPIALISLVDTGRVWVKSSHGTSLTEFPRANGLCSTAILKDSVHIISDTLADPATAQNPLVKSDSGYRFYAGMPLRTPDGHHIGTLSAMDFHPRTLSIQDTETLQSLAKVVMAQIELRCPAVPVCPHHTKLTKEHSKMQSAIKAGCVGLWEMKPENRKFLWNIQMNKIYGFEEPADEVSLEEWLSFLHPGDTARVAREWDLAVSRKSPFHSEYRILQPGGSVRHIRSHAEIQNDQTTISAVGINLDFTDQYLRINSNLRRQQSVIARRKIPSRGIEN